MDSPGVTDAATRPVAAETPPVAAAAPGPSKRGRKAGSKVKCTPWTPAEDAQLTEIVQAKTVSKLVDLWKDAAEQLGTGRTQASVEQHWYYMQRKAGKPAGKENSGAGGTKRKMVEKSMRFASTTDGVHARGLKTGELKAACRSTASSPWAFLTACPGCGSEEWVEQPRSKSKSMPCHDTSVCPEERGMSIVHCAACGPFLVPHSVEGGEILYADEAGKVSVAPCKCKGCAAADAEYGEFEEEFGEGAEEMRWLAKCEAKGLCYECGAQHHGRAAEYWIEHPQDEGDSIPGVLFCYDCYDDVRSARRRGLGMSY